MAILRMRNKNMQFGPYLRPSRQNSFIVSEIGVGNTRVTSDLWLIVEI